MPTTLRQIGPARSGAMSRAVAGPLPVKRLMDLAVLTGTLPLWLPLVVLVAVLLAATQGGPLLHMQWRVGQGGVPFRMVKFRSMVPDAPALLAAHLARDHAAAREWADTAKLRDDPRVTPLGRVLRRYSLDELPQLWNVARGEMSLVGPRPVPAAELAHGYGPSAAAYLSVKPGVTGLWQVSGRNQLCYGTRVALDRRYARMHSPGLDAVILWRTLGAVMRGTGC